MFSLFALIAATSPSANDRAAGLRDDYYNCLDKRAALYAPGPDNAEIIAKAAIGECRILLDALVEAEIAAEKASDPAKDPVEIERRTRDWTTIEDVMGMVLSKRAMRVRMSR